MNKKLLYIGIVINRGKLNFGALDNKAQIILRSDLEIIYNKEEITQKQFIDHILTGINSIKNNKTLQNYHIKAIGISCPGSVSSDALEILISPCFNWSNFKLGKIIEEKEKVPVFIDNDVNIITIGEHFCGVGKGIKNLLCVHIASGIGCGLIINNKIYRGASNNVGEIGHMTLDINGHYCGCGNSGCFELYASNVALVKRAKGLLKFGGDSIVFQMIKNDLNKLTHQMIFKAALKGDNFALNIVEEVCDYLGIGIANIIDILNPEMVIVSSGIPETGKYLFDNTINIIKKRAHPISSDKLKFAFSKLGKDSVWLGLFKMMKEKNRIGECLSET